MAGPVAGHGPFTLVIVLEGDHVGAFAPAAGVEGLGGVVGVAGVVFQNDLVSPVVQPAVVLAERRESVLGLEGRGIRRQHQVLAPAQGRERLSIGPVARGELIADALGETVSRQIDGHGQLVVQLDELQVLGGSLGIPGRRRLVVHYLGNDERAGWGAEEQKRRKRTMHCDPPSVADAAGDNHPRPPGRTLRRIAPACRVGPRGAEFRRPLHAEVPVPSSNRL